MTYYIECLKKYAVFQGRARRQEYWMFVLFHTLIVLGLSVVDVMVGTYGEYGTGLFSTVYTFATALPATAVYFRRLHDTNRSGWWWLIGLVPVVGAIVLFIFLVQDGQAEANRFGPNPKA